MEKLPKARNKMDVPKTEKKKLTDEIIVKALEYKKEYLLEEEKRTGNDAYTQIVNIWGEGVFKILDLIKRLQAENERLKCNSYTTSWKGKFFEAKKEIEQLTEENDSYGKTINEASETIRKKNDRIVELQKQVDELTDERENMQAEILRFEDMKFTQEHCDLYSENETLKHWLKRLNADLANEKDWGKQQTKQAVKDTAKDALEQFVCAMVNMEYVGVNDDLYYQMLEVKDTLLKERYGVSYEENN